jgi:hypothetical protein
MAIRFGLNDSDAVGLARTQTKPGGNMALVKPITDFYKRRKQLSTIAHLINIELEGNHYVFENSELSLKIVRSLSITSKLQGFILLKSLLRFSDLYNFDIVHNTNNERFVLIQNKTSKIVTRPFKIFEPELKFELANFEGFYQILNYNILSNEIKRFLRRYAFFDDISWKHSCHIFRHLESSWQFSKGIPINIIANNLGDLESTVQNHYIHKELLSLFS